MRHIHLRRTIVRNRGQFMPLTQQRGSVKVCSLQIKQMFIVVHLCREKQPSFIRATPRPTPSNRTIGVCWATLNRAYLPRTQWYHWNARRSLRRTRQLCIAVSLSHTLSLNPPPSSKGPGGDKKWCSAKSLFELQSPKQIQQIILDLLLSHFPTNIQ